MVAKNFDSEILLFRTSIDKTNFEKPITEQKGLFRVS